jgi:hypothetical protein
MFLFDSFQGLPSSAHQADQHHLWKGGTFDVGGTEQFRRILADADVPVSRFTLVEGFYEQSLPSFDKSTIAKAAFINMDCDYYTSTKLALNFCKDLMQNFTLVYFDDLYSFAGNPGKGQLLAIHEFNGENKNVGLTPCPLLDRVAPGRIWWAWTNS